jgi:hypothetical protein
LIRIKDPVDIVGQAPPDLTSEQVIKNLRELITAIDRRVPRLERTGEVGIARNAAALRREALERIAELESQARDGRPGVKSSAPCPPSRAGI